MTKKIFTSLVLAVSSMMAIAQTPVSTSYRGAFAPAPEPMWTENWTNWDPQNASYRAPNVNVSGVITTNTTWTKDNVYLLQGTVFVDSLATLTIEPGTVVRGDASTVISALVIQRGAKIIANGTPCNPIVFTSSQAPGSRISGSWGGLIICGRGLNNLGTNVNIEGIGATNPRGRHGGTSPNDNSGSLSYVRIEFGGYAIAAGNEMNSLTMGSVGSGTTINHVQLSYGFDDAFEWFGGSVNCDHLVSYRTVDDDFDTDNGFSGLVQFALSVKDPGISDVGTGNGFLSEGFESDNNGSSPFTLTPKTSARFYNVTQIGAYRCGSNAGGITQPTSTGHRRGVRLRRGSELKIYNSIFMNNWKGLGMDADLFIGGASLAEFKNNVIAMDYTFNSNITNGTQSAVGLATAADGAAATAYLADPANGNNIVSTPCDVLTNAWDYLNPDYRPLAIGSGAALAGADLTPSIQIETPLYAANQSGELVVDIFEAGAGNSNGTITVSIPVPSGFTISVPSIAALSATPTSGTNGTTPVLGAPYNNGDWNFSLVAGVLTATSKAGVSIPSGGASSLGLTIKRNAATPSGTNSNVVVTVSGGADNTPANNGASNSLSTL
jgi:hypothetical protein